MFFLIVTNVISHRDTHNPSPGTLYIYQSILGLRAYHCYWLISSLYPIPFESLHNGEASSSVITPSWRNTSE